MSVRNRMLIVAVLGLIVVAAAFVGRGAQAVQASVTVNPGVDAVITDSGPLSEIVVGADTTVQVVDSSASTDGEVYPPDSISSCSPPGSADSGLWVAIGTGSSRTLYGPDMTSSIHCAGTATSSLMPDVTYTLMSQSVSGSGSSSSPYTIVTTVGLTAAMTLTQTITYVTGQPYFKQVATLNNTGASVTASIFHGADIYLAGSDAGYGYYDPLSGAIGGRNGVDSVTGQNVDCRSDSNAVPGPYYEFFSPITHWQRYVEDNYDTVWSDINAIKTGTGLPDTVYAPCTDNGMAVEWDGVTAAPGASGTVSDYFAFGTPQALTATATSMTTATATGTPPATGTATATMVPTAAPTHTPIVGTPGPASGRAYLMAPLTCNTAQTGSTTCGPNPPGVSMDGVLTFEHLLVMCQTLDNCYGQASGQIGSSFQVTQLTSALLRPSGPCPNGFCPDGGTLKFSGTGYYGSQHATFVFTGVDDDSTGADTLALAITPASGSALAFHWNCRDCFEVDIQP